MITAAQTRDIARDRACDVRHQRFWRPRLIRLYFFPCAFSEQRFTDPRRTPRRTFMSEHVYKKIELTGSSTKSIDDAITTAIAKASKTLRNLHWFEVTETRGQIEDGKVAYWQVTLKVGLRLED
jgi:hypothetical protein